MNLKIKKNPPTFSVPVVLSNLANHLVQRKCRTERRDRYIGDAQSDVRLWLEATSAQMPVRRSLFLGINDCGNSNLL